MAKKLPAGPELRDFPGQRSIPAMFSNSRSTSGTGRAVPLLEFLNRKSEKRGSLQGCVGDAGLTPAVRERLDAIRKNDTRFFTKQDEREERSKNASVDECSTSCNRKGPPLSKKSAEIILDKLGRAQVRAHVREAEDAFSECVEIHNWEGHLPSNASPSAEFIDLTEDEDPADDGSDGEVYLLDEDSGEMNRKRKRSHVEGAAMEICPICNDVFPQEMLQAHVESEMDDVESIETDSVAQSQGGSGGGRGYRGRFSERSHNFKGTGMNSRPMPGVLVLGDEPRSRRRANVPRLQNQPTSSTFNHYADGGGWWDEGGVGVDVEAVGSACVWEGLGSITFGGVL